MRLSLPSSPLTASSVIEVRLIKQKWGRLIFLSIDDPKKILPVHNSISNKTTKISKQIYPLLPQNLPVLELSDKRQ